MTNRRDADAPSSADQRVPDGSWANAEADSEFRHLVQAKRGFILPATLFFIVYYFALPVLVGYWPEVMSRDVIGEINLAYLFALSQFGMAWVIMVLYVRRARGFDRMVEALVGRLRGVRR